MSEKEYYLLTSDAWVPESVTLTGTFSSSGKIVTGSGTAFLSEIQGGDWLINTTTKEVAMVRTIDTDVRLELYKGFTNASGEDVVVVKKDKAKVIYARIKNASGADITIDGQTLPDTDSIEEGKPNKAGFRFQFIKPKYITTTGNTIVNLDHFGTPPQAKQQFIGLLDEYTGAAAAYSLRQLSSSYTGSAIRVRRSSDNAEQDIGFASNELDTASLLSFVGAGDGFVTTWYDQSGSSNDATQATASAQPKIVDAGVLVTENGKAAVDFDAVRGLLNTLFFVSQPNTNIVVGSMKQQTGVFYDGNVTSTRQFIFGDNSVGFRFFAGKVGVENPPFDTNQNLHYGLANGLSSEYYINSSLRDSGDAGILPLSNLSIGSAIGGAAPLIGTIQELLFYPSNQSANRTGIETNINNFYSIY